MFPVSKKKKKIEGMGHGSNNIGKYKFIRTIGEGSFAKVKLAVDTTNDHHVAIKIIDKQMVMENNLREQVSRLFIINELICLLNL